MYMCCFFFLPDGFMFVMMSLKVVSVLIKACFPVNFSVVSLFPELLHPCQGTWRLVLEII